MLQKAQDIAFNGSSNTGWQIIGTNHSLSPSARFSNLPSDTQVISGGTGGAWNRLQSLIVTPSTNNVPNTYTGGPPSQFYGGSTVLGASNVSARFGESYNNASYDPALLIGSTNGNAPFIDIVNGELATVAGFSFQYKHNSIWSINSAGTGFTLNAASGLNLPNEGGASFSAIQTLLGASSVLGAGFVSNISGGRAEMDQIAYRTNSFTGGFIFYDANTTSSTLTDLMDLNSAATALNTAVVLLPNITADTGQTDASLCRKTSGGGQLYYGTGTLGICLGTSSERYKNGLAPLNLGLEETMKLHPQRGFLNADHGDPTKPYYWITAEDGYKAFPELTGLDAQGRPNTFDLLGLVPVTVNDIQALKRGEDALKAANDNTAATVAKLEARMDAQDRKIAALEAKVAQLSTHRHHTHHRKAA